MSNILHFPGIKQENDTPQQISEKLLSVSMKQHQDEAHARFWLANELMNLSIHVEDRKSFTIDDVIEWVIGGRDDVYAIAENHYDLD